MPHLEGGRGVNNITASVFAQNTQNMMQDYIA